MKDSIELDAEISVIEPMGHETVVICDSNYGELTGKVESSHTLKENMNVKLIIKKRKRYINLIKCQKKFIIISLFLIGRTTF